jgi:hypothetical protein
MLKRRAPAGPCAPQVVTVEPAGLSSSHGNKVRLLLVRRRAAGGARSGPALWQRARAATRRAPRPLRPARHPTPPHPTPPHPTPPHPTPPTQDFGEHGREFISSEVGLRFLQALADPAALGVAAGSPRRAARLRRILQDCVFKVRGAGRGAWGGRRRGRGGGARPGARCRGRANPSPA